MKRNLLTLILLLGTMAAWAQKTVYIPQEWRGMRSDTLLYAESDPDCKYTWSKTRSVETDNFIIFWDKGWGNTAPDKLSSSNFYYFDLTYMKQKLEEFYDVEINKLGFVDPVNSNVAKYKIMVLLNHTTTWTCFGGGYDYQVPALWLNPATSKPVGSAVAHEVGHSFHYMCYSEDSRQGSLWGVQTGFHGAVGNGATIWETTANWQALQSFPNEVFTESGTGDFFAHTHNYAFTHEFHRYQAYWFLFYLCERYNDIKTVANVWNTPETTVKDFNEVLMDCKGLSVKELYAMHHDFAMKAATYDFAVAVPYRNNYIGKFDYRCVGLDDGSYQVAYASCPQSTGFNIIPLSVPAEGTEITTHFTAMRPASDLAAADPVQYHNGDEFVKGSRTKYNTVTLASRRGFRLGYVALLKDGKREYFSADSVYCTGSGERTADVSMSVPAGTQRLWLVVSPAPTTYFQHKWDENVENDDQWPYRFSLEGTDIGASATVYSAATIDGRPVANIDITYDVYFPQNTGYTGTTFTVGGRAASMLGTALQIQPADIGSKMMAWASSGPTEDKAMFYAARQSGTVFSSGSTANGYGHWFSETGTVTSYASGYVYSEFNPSTLTFTIGPNGTKAANGKDYNIAQAIRYKKDGKVGKATFFFRVHVQKDRTGVELASIDYSDPTPVEAPEVAETVLDVFSVSGVKVKSAVSAAAATEGLAPGVYVVGKNKVLVR